MATIASRIRQWAREPMLPYELAKYEIPAVDSRFLLVVLTVLAALEVLAFALGGVFSVLAAYAWVALGFFSFGLMSREYLRAVWLDAKRGSFWGLLPAVAALPICFFNINSFGFINTEPLTELQHAFEVAQKPDLGYTDVFWFSYPTRSLLINLLPSTLFGIGVAQMKSGFSFPLYAGALFFFAGLRRYHRETRLASAVAGLVAAAIFAFPMMCHISRTFEMAISAVSFGLWAVGALLLFASQPSRATAIAAAWTLGLVASSFTPGLALVALLYLLLGVWLFRSVVREEKATSRAVGAVLFNSLVVGACLFLSRTRPLRARQVGLDEMLLAYQDAIGHLVSLSKPVFTPVELLVPLALGVLFAFSLRGGFLPLLVTAWCFPVVWGAANLHGKIGPGLPFALYRALLIVPALLFVFGRFLLWLLSRLEQRKMLTSGICVVLAVGLYFPLMSIYRACEVLRPPRDPRGHELLVMEALNVATTSGLTPFSEASVVDRTDEAKLNAVLPYLNYFLPRWTRVGRKDPLPFPSQGEKKPGIIIAMADSAVVLESFPGYHRTDYRKTIVFDPNKNQDFVFMVLTPE